VIDGELAKCDERGLPVFHLLRTGPRTKIDVALFAFDLLELNGEDLRREPIEATPQGTADEAIEAFQT
jgi:ATP-dependent DNA ligase